MSSRRPSSDQADKEITESAESPAELVARLLAPQQIPTPTVYPVSNPSPFAYFDNDTVSAGPWSEQASYVADGWSAQQKSRSTNARSAQQYVQQAAKAQPPQSVQPAAPEQRVNDVYVDDFNELEIDTDDTAWIEQAMADLQCDVDAERERKCAQATSVDSISQSIKQKMAVSDTDSWHVAEFTSGAAVLYTDPRTGVQERGKIISSNYQMGEEGVTLTVRLDSGNVRDTLQQYVCLA